MTPISLLSAMNRFSALLALLPPPGLSAAVVLSGPTSILIPNDFDGVYLDLDTGATSAGEFTGWDVNLAFGGSEIYVNDSFQPVRVGTGNLDAVVNLSPGAVVGSGSTFAGTAFGGSLNHLGPDLGQFQNGSEGFIGFAFMTNATPGPITGPHYGWLRVTLTSGSTTGTINGWAYESAAGTSIAVPEPSACAVLAGLAALGLARKRRRR